MDYPYFLFDLDGTVTTWEILPQIATALGLEAELDLLTHLTLTGIIDFETSFRLRFQILRSIPIPKVHEIVSCIPLDPHIFAFIQAHKDLCAIATGNLDIWIAPLLEKIGCKAYCSTGYVKGGELYLEKILHKGKLAAALTKKHTPLIAVGESVNDILMLQQADIGIAYGGVHQPVPEVVKTADEFFTDPLLLCEFLLQKLQVNKKTRIVSSAFVPLAEV